MRRVCRVGRDDADGASDDGFVEDVDTAADAPANDAPAGWTYPEIGGNPVGSGGPSVLVRGPIPPSPTTSPVSVDAVPAAHSRTGGRASAATRGAQRA
jgi:hypothetical protein